jgi:chitinase
MKNLQTPILVALILCSADFTAHAHWSTGYYAGWAYYSLPPSSIVWSAYTHICQFVVAPSYDGNLYFDEGLSGDMCSDLVAQAHSHGVKALITVWGGNLADVTAPSSRPALISSMIQLMQTYGYDGIDIDWESNVGGENYIALFRELRQELDKITPRPLLAAAVIPYFPSIAEIAPYCDQINDMSYWTTAAEMQQRMSIFLNLGIEKSKIGIGIGLDFDDGSSQEGPEIDCDPTACRNKCQFVIDNNYGGIMVWGMEKDAQMYGGATPCQDEITAYLQVPVATTHAGRVRQKPISIQQMGSGAAGPCFVRGVSGASQSDLSTIEIFNMKGSLLKSISYNLALASMRGFDRASPFPAGAYILKPLSHGAPPHRNK